MKKEKNIESPWRHNEPQNVGAYMPKQISFYIGHKLPFAEHFLPEEKWSNVCHLPLHLINRAVQK